MTILGEILTRKRERLVAATATVALEAMRERAKEGRASAKSHRLLATLTGDEINVIAEFKRRSPSKGIIRPGANPGEIARAYEVGGAKAISVLTEEDYFDGSIDDLRAVKSVTDLPVLR